MAMASGRNMGANCRLRTGTHCIQKVSRVEISWPSNDNSANILLNEKSIKERIMCTAAIERAHFKMGTLLVKDIISARTSQRMNGNKRLETWTKCERGAWKDPRQKVSHILDTRGARINEMQW